MRIEQTRRVLSEFRDEYQMSDESAIEVHCGFSGATVYRIPTATGEFALRQFSANASSLPRVLGLHRLLGWQHACGVTQTAVPVASKNGSTVLDIDGRHWQLEPWMPGTADYHSAPSRAKLHAAMKTLAEWHRAAARFVPRDSEREWFRCEPDAPSPAVGERLTKLNRWMSDRFRRAHAAHAASSRDDFHEVAAQVLEMFPVIAPRVAADLRLFATRTFRLQPCLRDVWHDHVLFTGENVTGLIDATACRCENVATDLSRLLGSLAEDDRAAWDFALDAYQQFRPLADAEWELIRVFDRSSVLLSGLFWLDRKYLRGMESADEAAIVARMRTVVRRQSALTG